MLSDPVLLLPVGSGIGACRRDTAATILSRFGCARGCRIPTSSILLPLDRMFEKPLFGVDIIVFRTVQEAVR